MMTSNSAGAAASARIQMPTMNLPSSAPSAGSSPSAPADPAYISGPTPDQIAKSDRQFFIDHSGPDAAQISLRALPDRAYVWIDAKFVGPTPLDLKLSPGHHQVLVRAPNMRDSIQDTDLAAKQILPISVALEPAYQSQVTIHWPSPK
jgi:hypothetical protein